jgi:hypothetical protein
MSGYDGPRINTNGLTFCVDPSDTNSLIGEPTNNLALNCPQSEGATKLMTAASNYAPVNTTAHSSLAVSTAISPPFSGMTVYKITDSNPDYYSRFGIGQSNSNKILVTDIGSYDVTYCASIYIYLPSSTSFGDSSVLGWVAQNSTGTDWHTGNYPTPQPTYGYYSGDIHSSQTTVNLNLRNVWQRASIVFTPSSTVRDYGGSNNCKYITIQFRPNLTGQSGANYIYVSSLQIEQRNYASRFVAGNRSTWFNNVNSSYNGTFYNNPNLNSSNQNCLSFNGTNQKAVTSFISFGNNATWEAWINCEQSINTYNMFMGRYLPYFGFYGGNRIIFSNNINGSQVTIYSPTNLVTNKWYYIVCTTSYNGTNTTMKIYVNGVEQASDSFAGAQYDGYTDQQFTIGDWYQNTDSSNMFKGKISAVRIYNRTLSPGEIRDNFNSMRTKFGV